jgi:hypothetical protein
MTTARCCLMASYGLIGDERLPKVEDGEGRALLTFTPTYSTHNLGRKHVMNIPAT